MKLHLAAFFLFILFAAAFGQEHDNHEHENEGQTVQQLSRDTVDEELENKSSRSATEEHEEEIEVDETIRIAASLSSFPTLHPLVVHFPVVLLIFAFFAQIVAYFTYRKVLSWVVLILIITGFIGGILAAEVFHPMISQDAPQHIKDLFEQHEHFAEYTLWISGIALILKIVSMVIGLKTWSEIVVGLFLLASASVVSLTGHLGSQMVYIEEVGPKGQHLGEHHHEE